MSAEPRKISVKCGRCHGRHENAAGVRACYNGENPARIEEQYQAGERATKPQVSYLSNLLHKAGAELISGHPDELPCRGEGSISTLIDGMKDYLGNSKPLPEGVQIEYDTSKALPSSYRSEVSQGYYATASTTGNNDLDFWFVRAKSNGYRKVSRVVGGHPTIMMGRTIREAALKAIEAAGEEEAGKLFAEKIGQCYRCNRHLTKYASRQIGMGRTCAGKNGMGELWDGIEAKAPAGYYTEER